VSGGYPTVTVIAASDNTSGDLSVGLPSNEDVLTPETPTFHFFVDSAEGVAVPLDAKRVDALADAAEERLLRTDPPQGR
jgi:hypothetical protein